MPCFHPLAAWKRKDGSITFRPGDGVGFQLQLACHQCIGCKLDHGRMWAVRCMHEAQLHKDNSYITLTYSPENLPAGGVLVKEHFQKFMKRVRRRFPRDKEDPDQIRYYYCGEYGEERGRPHFHALLFGLGFPDKKLWKVLRGNPLYTSETLSEIWGLGWCSIGAVTFQSAAYVARYLMKKISGPGSERFYRSVDTDTGEIINRPPEYARMSLKPGIGAGWFHQFKDDVYPGDFVVLEGKRLRVPSFYDLLFERTDGVAKLDVIKQERKRIAAKFISHKTPKRLAVREKVLQSKLKLLKRELK